MSVRVSALFVAIATCFAAHAAEPQTPAAAPPAVTVLKAAHLFDGRSGKLSEPGLVVVRGDDEDILLDVAERLGFGVELEAVLG